MSQTEKKRLGDVLFQDIDDNDYLNELYKNILYNYAITILQITNIKQLRGINVDDALRFADLLSKSTHAEKADSHKIWAHEIITMLLTLYPDDEVVRYYAGAVLTSTGNFMGRRLVESEYEGTVKHIYFVAETKGSMSSMQLRLIEESKIHCAREHFKAISNGNVVYDVVDSYQSLLEKVMK